MTEKSISNNSFTRDMKERMLKHMNNDHVDAMHDYCSYLNVDVGDNDPEMVAIDQSGFDLSVNGKRLRFHFKEKCSTPQEVRAALVELAETARAKIRSKK